MDIFMKKFRLLHLKLARIVEFTKTFFVLQISLVDFKSHAPASIYIRFSDLRVLAFSVSVSSLFFILLL
jgi:hypothetical protein